MKYWVLCETKNGGPGYAHTNRFDAIEHARKAWKTGFYESVFVQFDTPYGFLTIWKDGKDKE